MSSSLPLLMTMPMLGAMPPPFTGPVADVSGYQAAFDNSWVYDELKSVRNMRPSAHGPLGMWGAFLYAGVVHYLTGGREPFTLGLHSSGGSLAYLCPRSQVSVAILLNDCQLDYGVTRQVLELVCSELKLGHVSFLEQGLF